MERRIELGRDARDGALRKSIVSTHTGNLAPHEPIEGTP